MINNHLSPEEMTSYINEIFEEHENERIIAHLTECDQCLSQVDAIWDEKAKSTPNPISENLEKRLLNKIHRSNLAGNLIRLAVANFFGATIGVITPFMKTNTTKPTKKNK